MEIRKGNLITGAILASAFSVQAQTDTRQPIISRVEVKYSIVAHHNHRFDRANFYNQNGQPKGNTNYAVPHLVYEPIVTLYNPYNTTLTLPKVRVRIANPPVGFKFKKNNDYLRAEWNNCGPFLGLGRFQEANESNPNVEKTMTLLLRTGSNPATAPSGAIVLKPGQAIPFSTWVEPNWTWGLETATNLRPFLDSVADNDRTNRDPRTNNALGVETRDGNYSGQGYYWHDYRAGFQTDGLSVATGRPAATRYSFETGTWGATSWVAMKMSDTFGVEARGVDTVLDPLVPDFQLSLMTGATQNPITDTLKSYSFGIEDLAQPVTATPEAPSISRVFGVADILQAPSDITPGGKSPIASFLLMAKSTALRQKKFLADTQPPAKDLYEARLVGRFDFNGNYPFNGPSDLPQNGVSVTGFERMGDFLVLDVAAEPFRDPVGWKVMGGSDPAEMTTDLTSVTQITAGPEGTGIYKLKVALPPDNGKYFVKIAW